MLSIKLCFFPWALLRGSPGFWVISQISHYSFLPEAHFYTTSGTVDKLFNLFTACRAPNASGEHVVILLLCAIDFRR